MLGTTNENEEKNIDPAIWDLYMLEGREQVNVPATRKLELSDPHLLTRSVMTHGSRGRMKHAADDRDLCYSAEVNAAHQWVTGISDVTGSGVSYTTGQLQVTRSSGSSDDSCVNVNAGERH